MEMIDTVNLPAVETIEPANPIGSVVLEEILNFDLNIQRYSLIDHSRSQAHCHWDQENGIFSHRGMRRSACKFWLRQIELAP